MNYHACFACWIVRFAITSTTLGAPLDFQDIAAAALFLSSKLEEHPFRIRDLINCLDYLLRLVEFEGHRLADERRNGLNGSSSSAAPAPATGAVSSISSFKYEPMDYFAKHFYDWKDEIVIGESQILKVPCSREMEISDYAC